MRGKRRGSRKAKRKARRKVATGVPVARPSGDTIIRSPAIRRKFFYSVAEAGAQVHLSRSGSYRAVKRGEIPVERDGKFWLVPRQKWDRRVERLQRGEMKVEA